MVLLEGFDVHLHTEFFSLRVIGSGNIHNNPKIQIDPWNALVRPRLGLLFIFMYCHPELASVPNFSKIGLEEVGQN